MHEEPLPEVTWDPREPETRKEHDPRGVLHDLARLRLMTFDRAEEKPAAEA